MVRSVLGSVLIGLLAASCTTMTSAQSGRTVGDGNLRAYTGLTLAPLPAAEIDIRYGLTERLELAGGLALPGNIHARVKYGVFNSRHFSFGTGLGVSFLTMSGESNINDDENVDTTDQSNTNVGFSFSNTIINVPLYLGIHASDFFTLVLTPRVGYSLVSAEGKVDESTTKGYDGGLYTGGELGFLIGRSWGVNLSAGAYTGLPGLQVSLGFFIGEETSATVAKKDVKEDKQRRRRKKRASQKEG